MSEYQYYEFQLINGYLSEAAQAEMRQLSSRVELTSSSAAFLYNYGDFRGKPRAVLEKHFDMMLYITNWGTYQLMLKFPKTAIDLSKLGIYETEDYIEVDTTGQHVILNLNIWDEGGDSWDWVEGEGWLPRLVPLWEDILNGDYRAVYLAWLGALELTGAWDYSNHLYGIIDDDDEFKDEDEEEHLEPPVPANLQKLTPALRKYIEFIQLDRDLVSAAAETSPTITLETVQNLESLLDKLPPEEQRAYLLRLLRGETRLQFELTQRLREFLPKSEAPVSEAKRRTAKEILARADTFREIREEKERKVAQKAHLKRMVVIAEHEDKSWQEVDRLISQKKVKAYDEAVKILKELRELAEHRNELPAFKERSKAIKVQYPTLSGLHSRMDRAGVLFS